MQQRLSIPISAGPPPAMTMDRSDLIGRLVPVFVHELEDGSVEGRLHILRRLRRALRTERLRAWTHAPEYSPGRHADLLRACRVEEAALRAQLRAELHALSDWRAAA